MPDNRRRLRDPVHGLITFDRLDEVDETAWALLNTAEFQRLRRIKQLGVSEYTFPGATHTRFAHCIGVFHNARKLVKIIARESERNVDREKVAVLAALLHDVGHGPFSHAFEEAQKSLGVKKKHEIWTAELIKNPDGEIYPILGAELSEKVAKLLSSDIPEDIYHSVVSSSFDADRLDYLQRDRMMSGSGAGAIDFDWLLDNLTVRQMDMAAVGSEVEDLVYRPTFAFKRKAFQAAEAFLLARYHLYEQVYFHRTTRGVEQLISSLIRGVAEHAKAKTGADVGLSDDHPMMQFFEQSDPTADDYFYLDDSVVWGAIGLIAEAKDPRLADLADRILSRRLFYSLDIESDFGDGGEAKRGAIRRIEQTFSEKMKTSVLKDKIVFSAYGEIGADDVKAHKRLMIATGDHDIEEISEQSKVIDSLIKPRELNRYYFEDESDRATVRSWKEGN